MAAFDSSLSDPYISHLLSNSSNVRRSSQQANKHMIKAASAPSSSGSAPNLVQFIESVPSPITLLLVELAPAISYLRWAAEVLSWKSHWSDSCLTLAGWWAICLGANVFLRYLLPLTFLLPALSLYLPSRRARPVALTNENLIANSLSDLTMLRILLPTPPALTPVPIMAAVRVSALIYIPYMVVRHFVPMPIQLGIVGTLLITYRAQWARTLRTTLWRSAYIQRFLLHFWFILSGIDVSLNEPFDAKVSSPPISQQPGSELASAPPSPSVQFLFTILECQRWWMGLDWTAALLPGERPSWCDVHHQPVSPPSVFSLPSPASVFLSTHNGKRTKRTATWRWEDREWCIIVNKDDRGPIKVEKKPVSAEDEENGSKIATKAVNMFKERTVSMGSASEHTVGKDDRELGTDGTVADRAEPEHAGDLATDSEGWVYGDNKWEATSAKGGIGKYTRYRRWMRIAILEESVEEVESGELGVHRDAADRTQFVGEGVERRSSQSDGTEKASVGTSISPKRDDGRRGSREEPSLALRERLKSAVKNVRSVS